MVQLRNAKSLAEIFSSFAYFDRAILLVASVFFCFVPVKMFADEPSPNAVVDWVFTATNHLGQWIWETNTFDKQTVRFGKAFDVPAGEKISSARLHITVDNGYTLFLDGEEIGRGSDWRTVTEYDVTQLLRPGRHFLGVEGFNDRLEGGLIFGLHIGFATGQFLEIISDHTWLVAPGDGGKWNGKKLNEAHSHPVRVVGPLRTRPWENWPYGLATVPPLRPQTVHFWQRGWFQLGLFLISAGAVLVSLWLLTQLSAQSKAQKFLQVERARIARDIHDDLGAQLTQLLLLGEVAQREQPEDSPARGQFTHICDRARELAQAMDEVVWAVNSRRDTVRDFTSYVCKYAQIFLNATNIRCRLDVEPEIPATPFDLPVRRNLFLAVKEALNNAAKHSAADELFLRIYRRGKFLSVAVEDNGRGFDPDAAGTERNGLSNMAQRMAEIGGTCALSSQPGGGCLVVFTVPLPAERRGWFRRTPAETGANKIEIPRAET
jgi:signal transduction histidine kinase